MNQPVSRDPASRLFELAARVAVDRTSELGASRVDADFRRGIVPADFTAVETRGLLERSAWDG